MPYTESILGEKSLYLRGSPAYQFSPQDTRRPFEDFMTEGVRAPGDLAGSFVSGLITRTAAGRAWVLGDDIADQGMYRQRLSAAVDLTTAAGHATLNRIDTVVLRILDHDAQANNLYESRISIIPGTPTSGAQINDSGGAGYLAGIDPLTALENNTKAILPLYYIWVPAGAAALTSTATNILDARVRARLGRRLFVEVDPSAVAQRGTSDTAAAHKQVLTFDTTLGRSVWDWSTLPGQIIFWPGPAVPAGFVIADGVAYSRTTYVDTYNALTLLTTGSTTSGSPTVTNIPTTAEIAIGDQVEGAGIPAGTTVTGLTATTVTLSANATATASGVSIRFFPYGNGNGTTTFNIPDYRGRALYGQGTHTYVDKLRDNDGKAVGSRTPKDVVVTPQTSSVYSSGSNAAGYVAGTTNEHDHGYGVVKVCIRLA